MSPHHHDDWDHLYLERLGASRHAARPSQAIWDRLSEPAVLITIAIAVFTVAYHVYTSYDQFGQGLSLVGEGLWDGLIYVLPCQLVFAVDDWLHNTSHGQNTSASDRPTSTHEQMGSQDPGDIHAAKSAAMRRILRLDRGRGMMATVIQARNRALSLTSSALGARFDPYQPAGLGNRDNSCFQNSILQGLASVESLPSYLALCLEKPSTRAPDGNDDKGTNTSDDDDSDPSKAVAQTLSTLLADLNNSSNNGRTLWTPGKLKFLSTWTQQDAQEYYSKILDDLDKRAARAVSSSARRRYSGFESDSSREESTSGSEDSGHSGRSEDSGYQSLADSSAWGKGGRKDASAGASAIRNPLEGLLAQRVACVQCGYSEGLSMIPFNCLTLSLGLRRQHDLYERLDAYSSLEAIEGVECPKCTLLKAQRLLAKLTEQMRAKGLSDEQLAEPLRRLEAVELALEEDSFDDDTINNKCKITSQTKVSTTKTKQIVVARPPQSLAVHVNRSVFDPSTFDMVKNSAPVAFPMMLDLGPWCLGSAEGTEGHPDSLDLKTNSGQTDDVKGDAAKMRRSTVEQWLQDPTASMVAGDVSPSRLSGPVYELRAVVTHSGRHENGHYICYRKYPRANGPAPTEHAGQQAKSQDVGDVDSSDDGSDRGRRDSSAQVDGAGDDETSRDREFDWWRLSDDNVSRVSEDVVAGLGSGVFMLFYDCVDANVVVQESEEVARSGSMTRAVEPTEVMSDPLEDSRPGQTDATAPHEEAEGDKVQTEIPPNITQTETEVITEASPQ